MNTQVSHNLWLLVYCMNKQSNFITTPKVYIDFVIVHLMFYMLH